MNGQGARIVRARDFFVCELEFVGLAVQGSVPTRRLALDGSGAHPIVVVHLPAQHVAEQAFLEERPPHERVLVQSRAAGPSRVAFRIDPGALPVDYKLETILALLAQSRLAVPASAARGSAPSGCLSLLGYFFSAPALAEPGAAETAIELPFRLILSPESEAGFRHMTAPVTGMASTRTELWHSLLEPAADRTGQRELRAIWLRQGDGLSWSPSDPRWPHSSNGGDEPFPIVTMHQRDRSDIVHVSGNRRYAYQTGTDYEPRPVAVRRLALGALGAWLDSRGDWTPPPQVTSLVEWTHRATQGRDHFVRIVRQGFLYPFGHLAAKVEVSERKFVAEEPPRGDPPLLLKRVFIVVRQPVKNFDPGAAPAGQWHTMPLREVRLRTLVTPGLEVPAGSDDCFLVVSADDGRPVEFKLTATDAERNKLDLATPLVWIDSTKGSDPATIQKARGLYNSEPRHVLDAKGVGLALAPGPNGDTTFAAHRVVFGTPQNPAPLPATGDQPGFWPELVTAEVRAPALEIVAGVGEKAVFEYHKAYRDHGLGGANLNEVIAQLHSGSPLQLDFSDKGDRAGGLIQPSMAVGGLSRRLGPVGGAVAKLDEIAASKFDPASFFAGAPSLPRLFGVFTLDQVLGIITGTQPSDVPRIVTEKVTDATGGNVADSLAGKQVWEPVPVSYPKNNPIFVVDNATSMKVIATFDARSPSPHADVHGEITNFRIHLLGDPTFLRIGFNKIEFGAETGRKPDVNVEMGQIEFVGPLSFVEEIKTLIPLDGFSDPPALDVRPDGIHSSLSLALPDLAVGVFALQNLSLGAGFAIPFTDGALTVTFNFCKREEPFLLTVSLFGGGGFFALSIDPNGVQVLEAALEFGASVAINLGVAQGGVHVMAGIYFKIESEKGCTLTGYFRLGGNMSVLGLISVSIEMVLSFTYKDPGKAVGRAVVTVEIDIFLFSTSVQVECEREFAGSDSDPSFHELMGPYEDAEGAKVRPWHDYCEAFA